MLFFSKLFDFIVMKAMEPMDVLFLKEVLNPHFSFELISNDTSILDRNSNPNNCIIVKNRHFVFVFLPLFLFILFHLSRCLAVF